MGLTRRTVLQRAGLGLLTVGISQLGLECQIAQIHRYAGTLAASSPRKLALLIGIDRYSDGSNSDLKGCATDVELQRELLIYRFGFQPDDVLTLSGQQATREGIETAFVEHLLTQARSGDIVVFHFSGYGNQVKLPEPQRWVKSFLPSDGIVGGKNLAMNDLLEETLFLLGRSLATDKLTMVLDTSHYSTGKLFQGNLRVRSFPVPTDRPDPEEIAFKEQLQQQFKGVIDRQKLSFPGILLRASGQDRVATEITGNGWNAGLFTYALTQYLWQVAPASQVYIALRQVSETIAQVAGQQQQPQLLTNGKSQLTYDRMPENAFGGEGVIAKVEDELVEVHLTGLPALVLDIYGLNSCFSVVPSPLANRVPSDTESEILLQISSRQGMRAKVHQISPSSPSQPLQVGQIVQEKVRVLPRHPGLVVALDSSLSRIERVDATSAFAAIPVVSAVVNAGGQRADCLLSCVPTNTQEEGYGLLSAGGTLIPNSVGTASEAVKSAVQRLVGQLETLLAAKLWRLTTNEGSSRLKVSAKLEKVAQTPQVLLRRDTRQAALMACGKRDEGAYLAKLPTCPQGLPPGILTETTTTATQESDRLLKLAVGTEIYLKIENHEDIPLYCLIFGMDTGGNASMLGASPTNSEKTQASPYKLLPYVVEPGKSGLISQSVTSRMKVAGPVGLAEYLLICSVTPFEQTLAAVSTNQNPKNELESILTLSHPLAVARALWQDLHLASSSSSKIPIETIETCLFDVGTWATLTFIYQVAE